MTLLQMNFDVSTTDLVKSIFSSDIIVNSVDELTTYTVIVATALLPIFYSITWVWSYAKHSVLGIGEKPKFFEKSDLIRPAILWLLIGTYPYAFGAIEGLAFEIIEKTEPDNYVSWKANQGALALAIMNNNESAENGANEDTQQSSSSGFPQVMWDILGAINSLGGSWISGIFAFLGFIVSTVVAGLSYLISKVFYVIGPLAIAFSILPPFKDKLEKWFGTWLAVTLNMLTLNLITLLLISMTLAPLESIGVSLASGDSASLGDGNTFAVAIFNVIMIVMYVLSFWVTSYIVGSADAGKVLSTAVGAASSLMAYSAMKGAGAAAGAAGGGSAASAVPNVLGATKNTQ